MKKEKNPKGWGKWRKNNVNVLHGTRSSSAADGHCATAESLIGTDQRSTPLQQWRPCPRYLLVGHRDYGTATNCTNPKGWSSFQPARTTFQEHPKQHLRPPEAKPRAKRKTPSSNWWAESCCSGSSKPAAAIESVGTARSNFPSIYARKELFIVSSGEMVMAEHPSLLILSGWWSPERMLCDRGSRGRLEDLMARRNYRCGHIWSLALRVGC